MPARIRLFLPAVGLVVIGLIVVLVITRSGGSSTPTLAVRHEPMITIFEADPQLKADPIGTLDKLRKLGVDAVRVTLPWGDWYGSTFAPDPHAPTPPPGFNGADPAAYPQASWAPYDAIVRDAAARGIAVDLSLGPGPPVWAAGHGDPNPQAYPQWEPSAPLFGAFVRAVGTRYGGHYRPAGAVRPLPRVHFWGIWNEPNYGPDIVPQTTRSSQSEASPWIYLRLLDAGWAALNATGHSTRTDTILFGEVAPEGPTLGPNTGLAGHLAPLRFLRALYCVDSSFHLLSGQAAAMRQCPTDAAAAAAFVRRHPALFKATAFADHPYTNGPPTRPAQFEPDYSALPNLPALEMTLDRALRAHGVQRDLPIFSTEFGYMTNPPETLLGTVTPEVAAYYLNWSEYVSWRDSRMRSYDQYLLLDDPRGIFATALEFPDGKPKPTYGAFRLPIYLPVSSASAGQRVIVWGCVRPAYFARHDTGRAQRVEIQFRAGAGQPYRTLQTVTLTDRYGYFEALQAFGRSGDVRLRWEYPHGPAIDSRTATITVH